MIGRRDERSDLLDVSRETIARLEGLLILVKKWTKTINLVAKSTIDDAWTRHILDSAQIYSLAPQAVARWADLGSGGGFPGLVIACLAAEKNPDMDIVLVEADQRKGAFLLQANQLLGLKARILTDRIEVLPPLQADVVSARALAPLDRLCGLASRHMVPGACALFQKGVNHLAEIDVAKRDWRFDAEVYPSAIETTAVILKIRGLSHV